MGPPAKAVRWYRLMDLSRRLQRIARWIWDQHQVACCLCSFLLSFCTNLFGPSPPCAIHATAFSLSSLLPVPAVTGERLHSGAAPRSHVCWAELVLTLGFYGGRQERSTVSIDRSL